MKTRHKILIYFIIIFLVLTFYYFSGYFETSSSEVSYGLMDSCFCFCRLLWLFGSSSKTGMPLELDSISPKDVMVDQLELSWLSVTDRTSSLLLSWPWLIADIDEYDFESENSYRDSSTSEYELVNDSNWSSLLDDIYSVSESFEASISVYIFFFSRYFTFWLLDICYWSTYFMFYSGRKHFFIFG